MPATVPDTMELLVPPAGDTPAVVRVRVGKSVSVYFAAEVPCEEPGHRAWEVVRYDPARRGYEAAVARYNVLVEEPRSGLPVRGSCECEAGTYRPDRGPCRHLRFLAALWARGLI